MSSSKRNSHRFKTRLWVAGFAACLCVAVVALAQTLPGTAAPGNPFEVYGELYSGSAPAGFQLGDGWAQGASHFGVLDADGNPAVDGDGVPFRASRQIDSNWGNQGDGIDFTLFAGSNKNPDLIGATDMPWEWDVGTGGPQKNDLTNAYFHTRVDPVTGDRWVFVAAETRSINGDSHVDFEFNQAGILQTGEVEGELIGLGPDGGRTINDFLITIDFQQGGEHPLASVRFWNGSSFELVSVPGSVYSATNLIDIPHGADGSWKHFTDDGAETDVLTRLQLVEGAANLSALQIGVDACSTDATFLAKTRSSASWTADLKDFAIVRFPLEPAPELVITGPDNVCAGASFEATVEELTGLHNTTYLWTASGCGSITSDPTATTVTVQANQACNCDITLGVTVTGGECGHVVSTQATVRVGDTVFPELSDEPADATVECDAVPSPSEITASDNCTDPEVSFDETTEAGSCGGSSTITRTWSTSDDCDNVTSHTQTVTVEDTTAPTMEGVPVDAEASCDSVPQAATVTALDNCSEAGVELSEATVPGGCEGDYTLTRTWTATDECGNSDSQSQTIVVSDTAAPVLSGVPADVEASCDAVPEPAVVTASDNCSTAIVELDEVNEPGACVGQATITRTWTATDDCSNAASQAQTITVVDTTAPELIGVPPNVTVECDSIPAPAEVTATDNCSEPTVELREETAQGEGAGKAMITRTWTATDSCGNQTTGSQLITVVDTTAPQLQGLPPDMTVECDAVPEPPEVTATDNCAVPAVDYAEEILPGDCPGRYVITRMWTATDDCGNKTSHTQTITVVDTTKPVLIDVPADVTAECDAVPLPADVTASDNCGTASVELEEISEPGACSGASTITRTWTATDECGNEASQTQVITVEDTTLPVLSDDPADMVVECDAVPEAITLTATDNCDADVPVVEDEQETPGDCPGNYELLRTWTATDDCENEASVDRIVSVVDTTPPTIALHPEGTQYICDGRPVFYDVETADNCVAADLTAGSIFMITAHSQVDVTISPLPGPTAVITATGPAQMWGSFSATDACNNVSEPFSFNIMAVIGQEACSQGFWKNHTELWGPAGYDPNDRLVDAFEISDFSSPEIPAGFDPELTLIDALLDTGGSFSQALIQGTAALLNAAHPSVDFPLRESDVKAAMQAAFAGEITFDEARAYFNTGNAAERECGCPIS